MSFYKNLLSIEYLTGSVKMDLNKCIIKSKKTSDIKDLQVIECRSIITKNISNKNLSKNLKSVI
jgi:hypothetical protein